VSLPGTVNKGETGDATGGSLEVELDDYYFGPAYIKAKPGETITLHLKNEGKAAHTFTSTALGVDQQLSPDQDMDVTVTMPMTGATEFHCRFHQSLGMQGAFFFNAGDAVGGGAAPTSSSTADTNGGYNYN
jgi:plastocyanin